MLRTFRTFLLSCSLFALCHSALAQDQVQAVVIDGDTMPYYSLPEVQVVAQLTAKLRRKTERLDRLTRNVQKVFPYALVTAKLLDEYDHDLASIEKEKDKDLYLKLAEAELRAEFEDELKNMTVTQGRLLIKLIDRETGSTSYDLVKQLRGAFQAWLWQGVATIFGNDLKDEYDPEGNDVVVESIVRRIENGDLACTPRAAKTEKAQARLERRKARLYKKYGLPMHQAATDN